ncbi:MAG: hypothetical protein ACT4RN_10775 [Pseudonocardia sp.]
MRRRLADGPRTQAQLVASLQEDGFPRWTWYGVQLSIDLVRAPEPFHDLAAAAAREVDAEAERLTGWYRS